MRQLTPAEVRQVEKARRILLTLPNPLVIGSTEEDKDLWLTVLDLALSQNESMKREWVKK